MCLFHREMLDFTANAREWMSADKQNVIAIHCKGGKGRTGTMICTWLIDSGLLESAQVQLNPNKQTSPKLKILSLSLTLSCWGGNCFKQ